MFNFHIKQQQQLVTLNRVYVFKAFLDPKEQRFSNNSVFPMKEVRKKYSEKESTDEYGNKATSHLCVVVKEDNLDLANLH